MPLYLATLNIKSVCLLSSLTIRANYIVFPHYTPFTTICGQGPYMAHTVYMDYLHLGERHLQL